MGIAVDPGTLRASFDSVVLGAISRSGLAVPSIAQALGGGRLGRHTEYLGPLLAEMQVLARAHPGASW